MKRIPNFFTLLNLLCGCIAIVFILQTGETIVLMDDSGATQVNLPEKIEWGALFIFLAAIVDFFDGFFARLFKASSEMGKQLDSLSDVVSFGVAPGMILYQLLRIGYAQQENGLNVSILALLPAFIFSCAVAYRLARFNISTDQSDSFRGVPSPAAALAVASFPLIILYQYFGVQFYLINQWVLYAIILVLSYLMLCSQRFMALKFSNFSYRNNSAKYILIFIGIVCVLFLQWLAVPVIFIAYVLLSLFFKPQHTIPAQKQNIDIPV